MLLVKRLLLLAGLPFLVVACQSVAAPTPTLAVPTPVADQPAIQPEASATLAPTSTPAPTEQPANTPTDQPTVPPTDEPTAVPTTQPPAAAPAYAVAFVAADDVLNVRSGPGVENAVVAALPPDATGVSITGQGEVVAGSTWVPIAAGEISGWVNGRFLTGDISSETFCQSEAVVEILADLQTAVARQDGDLLARLVHPERGLRLRYSWWNPEVLVRGDAVANLFTGDASYDWGIEDGSGDPIVGPFGQEILPLLEQDFLAASESACDEILHGGAAGFVRLPEGYEPVRYYSFFRPGTEEFAELDWGAWVAGVEWWQGEFFLSYLVHFAWEI